MQKPGFQLSSAVSPVCDCVVPRLDRKSSDGRFNFQVEHRYSTVCT